MTGGAEWIGTHWLPVSRVQIYSTAGAVEGLPDINTPRMFHACGHYIGDDKVVTILKICNML